MRPDVRILICIFRKNDTARISAAEGVIVGTSHNLDLGPINKRDAHFLPAQVGDKFAWELVEIAATFLRDAVPDDFLAMAVLRENVKVCANFLYCAPNHVVPARKILSVTARPDEHSALTSCVHGLFERALIGSWTISDTNMEFRGW